MTERKTVDVKIAVAVDKDGAWSACGWGKSGEEGTANHAYCVDTLEAGEARYFVYATLELPATEDVEGRSEEAPHDAP